jgi:hypothetical protein
LKKPKKGETAGDHLAKNFKGLDRDQTLDAPPSALPKPGEERSFNDSLEQKQLGKKAKVAAYIPTNPFDGKTSL